MWQVMRCVFTCTWADVARGRFAHSRQLIEMVGMKGNAAVFWPQKCSTVLSWNRKGATMGIHKWEGDARNTWESSGIL